MAAISKLQISMHCSKNWMQSIHFLKKKKKYGDAFDSLRDKKNINKNAEWSGMNESRMLLSILLLASVNKIITIIAY